MSRRKKQPDGVPHWLELEFEISARVWMLKEADKRSPKTPMDAMIDRATGYDKIRAKDVRRTMKELVGLFRQYGKATGKDTSDDVAKAEKVIESLNAIIRRRSK